MSILKCLGRIYLSFRGIFIYRLYVLLLLCHLQYSYVVFSMENYILSYYKNEKITYCIEYYSQIITIFVNI